jgi:molybdenum cofactor cytidylyltransferase
VIVVLGAEVDGVALEIKDLPAQIAHNPDWERGLGTSIRKGMAELSGLELRAAAVVLMVCDQPFVTSAVIAALITAHTQTAKPIIASVYADTLGVPALFDRSYFPQLAVLPDARGAKQIISSHLGDVARVPFAQGAIDVDTAADYERLNPHRTS